MIGASGTRRKRSPAGISNPNAGDVDPTPAGEHMPGIRCREPGFDQIGDELGCEAMGQHDRFGASIRLAALPMALIKATPPKRG
jgi:hypothetical protein